MAGEVAGQVQQQAGQAAQQARTRIVENGGKALARARVAVDRQSVVFGEQVNTLAQQSRLTSAELRRQGQETPAKLIEQAADRGQQLGDWLKQLDADKLASYASRVQPGKALSTVEGFGRRRPLVVLAAGAAVGFLPARLLKASSVKRYSASSMGGQPPQDMQSPSLATEASVGTGSSTSDAQRITAQPVDSALPEGATFRETIAPASPSSDPAL